MVLGRFVLAYEGTNTTVYVVVEPFVQDHTPFAGLQNKINREIDKDSADFIVFSRLVATLRASELFMVGRFHSSRVIVPIACVIGTCSYVNLGDLVFISNMHLRPHSS